MPRFKHVCKPMQHKQQRRAGGQCARRVAAAEPVQVNAAGFRVQALGMPVNKCSISSSGAPAGSAPGTLQPRKRSSSRV